MMMMMMMMIEQIKQKFDLSKTTDENYLDGPKKQHLGFLKHKSPVSTMPD